MKTTISLNSSLVIFLFISTFIFMYFFGDPIPQDQSYHSFADTRNIFLIANFFNVVSNIPFLIFGSLGIYYSLKYKPETLLNAYTIFFIGVSLTFFGSLYYHLAPNNESLFWDRLPMTISFMAFFSIILSEWLDSGFGKKLLYPLLLFGFVSVTYWTFTENRGNGDLRLYLVVQFLPLVLTPTILLISKKQQKIKKHIWYILLTYLLAKLFEIYDEPIYNLGGFISGHTLKHIAASFAPLFLISLLKKQTDN